MTDPDAPRPRALIEADLAEAREDYLKLSTYVLAADVAPLLAALGKTCADAGHWEGEYDDACMKLAEALARIAAVEKLHQPEPGQHPDFCGHDRHQMPCPTIRALDRGQAQRDAALARIAAVEKLADQWVDLLRAQSQIMTTPQRNAWRDALAELRHALS